MVRARDAERVVALAPAAEVAGVEEVEPAAAADDRRAFDEVAERERRVLLPSLVVVNQRAPLARQSRAVFRKALRPDGRRLAHAVAVLLPEEVARAALVRDGERVNRAGLLADERAAVGVRPLRARGRGDGDAQRPILLAPDVLDEEASAVLRAFRRPDTPDRPLGSL